MSRIPEQEFKLTLKNRRNINIKLKLRYNDLCADWTAEIIDNSTEKTLIDTLPLVPGVNLLGQFGYLNIGEAYVIPTTDTELMMPDNTTLDLSLLLYGVITHEWSIMGTPLADSCK
ncbi:MAG: phage baseplate plug protein [Dialister invisus]|uniref:phage baseplate plug family protein n=1 Tax=Dialister invisus TaxID=218538 RepID=UPI00399A686E